MAVWLSATTQQAAACPLQDSIPAVQDSVRQLKEVEVKATSIVKRPDGMMFFPSALQKESSPNGYSLLNKLSMPMIRIDEARRFVTSLNGKGVQVRINGTVSDKASLLALDPKTVTSVEFINQPGVRYGEDIGYVIAIRTHRTDTGYTLGTDLSQAATTRQGDDMIYAKWNHKLSELSFSYGFSYYDTRQTRYHEYTDYLLNDGSTHHIERKDSAQRQRGFNNHIQLKYSLADSASYVFQATLSTGFSHNPSEWKLSRFTETGKPASVTTERDHGKSLSPVIDLYFYHTLGLHQSLTANVMGTTIATRRYQFNVEGTPYAYNVDGRTWSMTSEAIYENRLKPFTLSLGIRHQLKYTRNRYTGDLFSVNNLHNNTLYFFSQLKGQWRQLSYVAGLGVNNVRYRQDKNSYNWWLFHPKASLSWQINRPLSVTYNFEISQHISQIAMINDTRIRKNSMEWTVGNPYLRPNSVITHDLQLSWSKPGFYSQLNAEWRQNRHCNMAAYERTDNNQFLYTQRNQPHINMFYIMSYTRLDILPEKLTATFNGGLFRYFNRGDDYNHLLTTWLYGGSVQAYLGRWTLTAYANSGFKFMEGESWSHQEAVTSLQCGYRFGSCQLYLTWQHPLEANPRIMRGQLVNRYIQRHMTMHSRDNGNAIFISFSWKVKHGRTYKSASRTLQNKDTQTGILQASKHT